MSDWQNISTAPRDGTPILLAYSLQAKSKTWSRVEDVAVRPARWKQGFCRTTGAKQVGWQFEVPGFVVDPKAIIGWTYLPFPSLAESDQLGFSADLVKACKS
jgi:hypothetical protein